MKLRNLKINESIAKQYEDALKNDHTVLEPTEANALEVEEKRKEIIKDDFKEQDKVVDEVAKATNATETNEPKKVKDRKELSKLLAEAKEAGKQFKISRCKEEGYRYLFETIENEIVKENKVLVEEKEENIITSEEENKEVLTEEISARPNHDKMLDMLSQGVLDYKAVAEECLSQMSDDQVEDVLKAFDLDECNKIKKEVESLTESDEPAAESIENCQKWVDYDIEHYGDVSENTREIIEKAGFQIIKDDHGDYEVAARDYEESLVEETNYQKIMKTLDDLKVEESCDNKEMNELFDVNAGLNIDASGQSVGILGGTGSTDSGGGLVNLGDAGDLGEAKNNFKSAGQVINENPEWQSFKDPNQMRQTIIKILDDHKDEMEAKNYNYAKMSFAKANRNAIFGLVAAFTTGIAVDPNKEHKKQVKELESESEIDDDFNW